MKDKVQKKTAKNAGSRLKRYIVFISLISITLLSLLDFYKIEEVNVEGCSYYTKEQVIDQIITNHLEQNSLFLYSKYKLFKAKSIPFIQHLNITCVSNHKVNIEVYEKKMIACVKYMGEYVYFDKDGIILETSKSKLVNVPSITGVDFGGFSIYEKMQVKDAEIFDSILELSKLIKLYKIEIDQIDFNQKKEVTLATDGVMIYLGKKDLYDEQLANLPTILKTVKKNKTKGIIDMKNYEAGKNIILKKTVSR